MSVFFERFTLFCVITVITALSLIIVTSVQLAHEPDVVINRENGNLLDRWRSIRNGEGTRPLNNSTSSDRCPLVEKTRLFVLVNSPKSHRKVRQTIRSTWAHHGNLGVQVKFALTRSPEEHHSSFIQRHLKHFSRRCVPADYLLITTDLFFINTPQITAAINQQLPRRNTIICAKADPPQRKQTHNSVDPSFLTDCNLESPILISKDAIGATTPSPPLFGDHLYLSPKETAKIINGTIEATDLLFFFSAQVSGGAASINRLWMATRDYRTIES